MHAGTGLCQRQFSNVFGVSVIYWQIRCKADKMVNLQFTRQTLALPVVIA